MLDDQYLVLTNLAVRGPTIEHLIRVFTSYDPELYIPVTFISYQLNYLVAGLHPGVYHFTNLVLHALSGTLLAWVIHLLTGRKWAAFAAGLLWLVHPLNTEAVVWIAGRKDLLSTTFVLAATVAYLQYKESARKLTYALSIALFLLALLSKATVLTMPAIWLLFDWTKNRPLRWNLITEKLPHMVLSLIFLIVAMFGKARVLNESFYLDTALMAAKSTAFYLQKMILPIDLTAIYPYQKAITITSPDFFVPVLVLIGLAALVLWSLRFTRWGVTGALAYVILLSPTYFNFHKGEQIFFAVDRYPYLPSLGIFLLVAIAILWLEHVSKHYLNYKNAARAVIAVPLVLAIVLAVLSSRQTKVWSSDKSLFERALALYPDSIPARISLSVVYRDTGRLDQEREVLEEGLKQIPTVAYFTGLGSVAARTGQLEEAEKYYALGQQFDPQNPEPYFYLASLREQQGRTEEAIPLYQKATNLDDSYVAAFNNLGGIYQEAGKMELAERYFKHALLVNPNFMEGQYNLFQVLEMLDKNEEAYPHLILAYALAPEEPDIAIALAYRKMTRGETDEAKRILENLLEVHPESTAAKRFLDQMKIDAGASAPVVEAESRREERLRQRQGTQ